MARLERTREGILEGVSKLYLLLLNSIYYVVGGCISAQMKIVRLLLVFFIRCDTKLL